MSVLNLPADARPREKLLAQGPCALSDTELLALLLRTGLAGRGVLAMAQDLLDRFGGLSGLLRADASSLRQVPGLGGPAKRSQLLAVLEIARRALTQQLADRPAMDNPQTVALCLQAHLAHQPHEVFAVMFLDAQHRLIALEELFRGTLTETCVYPREVVLRALHHHAAAVVLAHNHPSGQVRPSEADGALTRHLAAALRLIDVRVLDHLVVAPGRWASLAQEGML
jgi:DNA repair protein RadC